MEFFLWLIAATMLAAAVGYGAARLSNSGRRIKAEKQGADVFVCQLRTSYVCWPITERAKKLFTLNFPTPNTHWGGYDFKRNDWEQEGLSMVLDNHLKTIEQIGL